MDFDAAISRSANPPGHVVLGVPLRHFSIGHWLYLHEAGVSYACGRANHEIGDLLAAVLICSETYDGFNTSLRNGGLRLAMLALARRLSGGRLGAIKRWIKRVILRRRIWPEEILGFDFTEQSNAFVAYLADQGACGFLSNAWAVPYIKSKETSSTAISVSEPAALLSAATVNLGLTHAAAIDAPLPWIRWQWATFVERNGWGEIMDVEEEMGDSARASEFANQVLSSPEALQEFIQKAHGNAN